MFLLMSNTGKKHVKMTTIKHYLTLKKGIQPDSILGFQNEVKFFQSNNLSKLFNF